MSALTRRGPLPVVLPRGRWVEYTQLSRQIRQAGLLERRRGWYAARIGLNLALLAAGWAALAVVGDSWWQLVTAAYLAVVFTQLAFVGHDAGHRQISRSRPANDRVGLLHANLLVGISFGWWCPPTPTTPTPTTRPTPTSASPRWPSPTARLPARAGPAAGPLPGPLFFPLLLLEAAHLHLASAKPSSAWAGQHRRGGAGGPLAGYLTALVLAVTGPGGGLRAGPPGPVRPVSGLLVRSQPQGHAHPDRRRGAGLPPTPGADLPQRDRQPVDLLLGGLNYQIEHHLFPNMPRPNLRHAQPLVRAFCAHHGLPYVEASLFGSYAQAIRHLHTVGTPLRPSQAVTD